MEYMEAIENDPEEGQNDNHGIFVFIFCATVMNNKDKIRIKDATNFN